MSAPGGRRVIDAAGAWQTALVKSKFVEAIQNYQQVEQQYRTKYKQRIERQFKIGVFPSITSPSYADYLSVKPDATPDEVRAVVNDEQGGQIFAQDVCQGVMSGPNFDAVQ